MESGIWKTHQCAFLIDDRDAIDRSIHEGLIFPNHNKIELFTLQIHLEKAIERWWEALTVDEPKIDLSKINCAKHFDEMAPDEQMEVQELVWNHQQKLLGKPTSEQIV